METERYNVCNVADVYLLQLRKTKFFGSTDYIEPSDWDQNLYLGLKA